MTMCHLGESAKVWKSLPEGVIYPYWEMYCYNLLRMREEIKTLQQESNNRRLIISRTRKLSSLLACNPLTTINS